MDSFSLNSDLLLQINRLGIFPHFIEKQREFFNRAEKIKEKSSRCHLCNSTLLLLEQLFDVSPKWIEFIYTNKKIYFWEAAVSEIFADRYQIRLRKSLRNKKKIIFTYSKDEILAHECSHILRAPFNSNKYEEIIAFQTSKSWRSYLGPLFSSSLETALFLLLTTAWTISCGFESRVGQMIAGLSFLSGLSFLFFRLFLRQRSFKKALYKTAKLLDNPKQNLFILFRMTDSEIDFFAKQELDSIRKFIQKQKSLRWRAIKRAYPFK